MDSLIKDGQDRLQVVRHTKTGEIESRYVQLSHEVLLVPLMDSTEYLDVTGAQFGQYQAVMPLKAYKDGWMDLDEPVENRAFGSRREQWNKEMRENAETTMLW